jgi:hypothetical protein
MSAVLRSSDARGHAELGWLDSRHSFSFSQYYDPRYMGYRSLRVINEDVVQPSSGFAEHGHADMEILTYVVHGALEHRDSTGEHSVIRPGEVQRMSAGTGIRHSEFNASAKDPVRLLQIWLLPERTGLAPGYEQKRFDAAAKQDHLCLIASADGRDGSLVVHQDADVYASLVSAGATVRLPLRAGRGAWLQVVDGQVAANRVVLSSGDGLAIEGIDTVDILGVADSEIVLFDLA